MAFCAPQQAGYSDALSLLSSQQQNYFGNTGKLQFADGVCRVNQPGLKTQVITFGADETGYYTELAFENPVGGPVSTTNGNPTKATQNHLVNLSNMYLLLSGSGNLGDVFGQIDNSIDAECRITFKETGKTEIINIKPNASGGYRASVKFV